MTASERARELVLVAAAAAEEKQGFDLVALDVSKLLPFSDVFLLVSARTERAALAIVGEIEDRLHPLGVTPLRREGLRDGRWVLLDFGDLVVHVFHEEERLYYQLERLWSDCPTVPVRATQ